MPPTAEADASFLSVCTGPTPFVCPGIACPSLTGDPGPMNVLIVDDSASVRAILKVYLMGLHPTFLDAEDGERALRILRLSPVDLVIADVQMLPMDGITF